MTDPVEKALGLALRYLASRARSRFEIRQYLSRRGMDQDLIRQVFSRLEEYGYIDDRAFARQFIEDRVRFKPKSKYALAYELNAKGIDPSLTEDLLAAYRDMDLALKAAEQRRDQWRQLPPEEQKKKVMNYLRYRGFAYGVCIAVWEKIFPPS